MAKAKSNVVTTHGICSEYGAVITRRQKKTRYRGKTIHAKCKPSPATEQKRNSSYT